MANNRMFLVHRPTGKAVMLGKRMASGWYRPGFNGQPDPLAKRMERLFELAEDHWENSQDDNLDDFVLVMEDAEGPTGAITEWTYDGVQVDGIFSIKLSIPQRSLDP